MHISRRRLGETIAGQVQSHTAEPAAQLFDAISINERPANARMKEKQDRTTSLIDIMNTIAIDLHKAALERIKLFIQPQCRWRHRCKGRNPLPGAGGK